MTYKEALKRFLDRGPLVEMVKEANGAYREARWRVELPLDELYLWDWPIEDADKDGVHIVQRDSQGREYRKCIPAAAIDPETREEAINEIVAKDIKDRIRKTADEEWRKRGEEKRERAQYLRLKAKFEPQSGEV